MKWQTLIKLLKEHGYDGDVKDLAEVKSYIDDNFGGEVQASGKSVDVDSLHAKAFPKQDALDITAGAQADAVADTVASVLKDLGVAGTQTKDDPNTNANAKGVKGGKERFEDDPMKGFKTQQEFLLQVIKCGDREPRDARMKHLRQKAAGSDEQGEYADNYGGFLVPEGMTSPEMLKVSTSADPTAGLTRAVPMQSPVVPFVARTDKNHTTSVSGGLTVSRKAETAAASSSRMEMEKVKLSANSLFGLTYASNELIADSPLSIAAMLADGYADEFASAMFNERLNGSGVGEYLGILNSPALVEVTRTTSSTVKALDVINIRARMWGYENAIWLANHNVYPQLAQMSVVTGTNAGNVAVYTPSTVVDRPDMLLGRPIYYTEYAETMGTKGDLICANWNEYLEGTYQPLQSAESMHVRFLNNEHAFRFSTRNDGQPWWRAALTPKKGSATLSPFATIAT